MKKRFLFLVAFSLVVIVLVGRDTLLTKGVEMYVSHKLVSKGWSYDEIQRDKNTLKLKNLKNLNSSGKILVKEVDASFHLSLFPLQLQPIVNLSHVSVDVLEGESSDDFFMGFLVCLEDSRLNLKLSIDEGNVSGILANPFGFSFTPGIEEREIGTLSIQDVERNTFLSTRLRWEGKSLVSEVEIEKAKTTDLIALTYFMQSPEFKKWNQSQGEISASIKGRFHPKHGLEEMEGTLDLQGISFSHPSSGIHVLSQSIKGTLLVSPEALKEKSLSFWKKVELFLTFEDTHFKVDQKDLQLGVEDALGEIRIMPTEDPYLKVGGVVLSDNRSIPFEIEGKGQLLDQGEYWLQTQASFFLSKKAPYIDVLFSQRTNDESVLHVECKEFSKEVFNVLQLAFPAFNLPTCQMKEGVFAGKFIGVFEKGEPKALSFSDCDLEGIQFSVPTEGLLVESQSITFSGNVNKSEANSFELSSLDATVRKLDLTFQNKEVVKSLSAKLGVELGEFTSSYAEGFCDGIWGSIQVLEPGAKDLFHVECKAYSSDLIQKFESVPSSSNRVGPVFMALDIAPFKESMHGSAMLRLISSSGIEDDIELELSLDRKISRNVNELFSNWDFSSFKGFFKTERLSFETAGMWARPWIGSLDPKGFLKGAGAFDGKGVSLEISQADFNLSNGSWDISAKLGSHDQQAHLAYVDGLWSGAVPVDFLKLQNSILKLDTEIQDSLIRFEGDKLWTDHFQANAFGSKVLGKMNLDKSGVHITSKAFEGSLESLKKIVPQYDMNSLEGTFAVEEKGCQLDGVKKGEEWSWDWKASFNLNELTYDLGSKGKVHRASARVEGDSLGNLKLKGLKGTYSLANQSCPFTLSDFRWSVKDPISSDFSLLAKDEKREWMHLKGKVEKKNQGAVISLAPTSHMLGLVVDVKPIAFNPQMKMAPIEFSSALKLEQLTAYLTMWKEMGFAIENTSMFRTYKGNIQLLGLYDLGSSSWKLSFKSPEVSRSQEALGSASGTVLGDGKNLKIESCKLGKWSCFGFLEMLDLEWNIPSLTLIWPEGKAQVKGKYTPSISQLQLINFIASLKEKNLAEVQVQGSFDGVYRQETSSFQGSGTTSLLATFPSALEMGIRSVKQVPFSFDSKKGVQVEKAQWDLTSNKKKIGKLSSDTMTYLMGGKRFLAQGISLKLPKDSYKELQSIAALKEVRIDQDLDVQGNLDFSSQYKKISGSIKNGTYTVKGTAFDLKQTTFLLEQDELYASCQTKIQEEPLFLQLKLKLADVLMGHLLVKENPEKKGLTAYLKKSPKAPWICDKVEGSFKGVTVKAQKDSKLNVYDLQLDADLSKVPSLLPKPWATSMKKWGLGKGYSFQGVLVLDSEKPFRVQSLKGDVSGEGFEFLGKTFDLFKAKLNFSENKGSIHSVKLQDDVANLSIKTIDLTYNKEIKSWDIVSPLIHVKDFTPSLLIKKETKGKGVEIKNLSLYSLKGVLNDVKSFEGTGALHFATETKKEFSFWDVPLGLMKDWGLDPGILTPVTGEADFVLSRGSFCFTALRNVYSEGKRSQFQLAGAGNDCYLSLDGNWHVDLAMKQNVVWKVTEDLVLSIRGTVENPKYSLKSSKKFR
jgi:hypothetical protein